jgi:arabinogalactan endo-1,4-beta-galactosidase
MLTSTICGVILLLLQMGCATKHVVHGEEDEVGIVLTKTTVKKAVMSGKDAKPTVGEVELQPGTVFKTYKNGDKILQELKAKGVQVIEEKK